MRLTILNVMVAIAVSAIGFELARAYFDAVASVFKPRPLSLQFFTLIPCLAVWSIALLLPVRPQRPGRSALKPGYAACLAGVFGVVAGLGMGLARVNAITPWKFWMVVPSDRFLFNAVLYTALPAGAAVGAVWTLLLLAGKWRCERDWREILGVAIGALWLVMPLVFGLMQIEKL
jgi:hypothetical protein